MKILVLSERYPPDSVGGAELGCQSHVDVLRQRGHRVDVLTGRCAAAEAAAWPGVRRAWFLDAEPPVEPDDPSRLPMWHVRRRYIQARRALIFRLNYRIARRTMRELRPDVAYAWRLGRVSIGPALAAQDERIPLVFRLPDYWLAELRSEICLEPSRLKSGFRRIVSGLGGFDRLDTSRLLAYSPALRSVYLAAGFPANSLSLVPEGVRGSEVTGERERQEARRGRGETVRLLFAGRLVPDKGPDIAIEALARLVEQPLGRPITLDIVGMGSADYESELAQRAARLGVAGRITFAGKVEHAELIRCFDNYDALLFTSRWVEPFGMTVIEAMARGLPVIASARGGPAGIISDGEDGLLVPPEDAAAVALAVTRLVQDPDLAERISCRALETVRARYTMERVGEQVERHLQAACRQGDLQADLAPTAWERGT